MLLLLFLFALGLTFIRGVLVLRIHYFLHQPPLRPEKHSQTPIISRKVRKSIRRTLCKKNSFCGLSRVYSRFISRESALGRESGGGGREKNTENKTGGGGLLPALVRVCPGCVGVCAWACDLMERLSASPVRPELASRTHPCRGVNLLQPNALCKTRPVMATTTSGF